MGGGGGGDDAGAAAGGAALPRPAAGRASRAAIVVVRDRAWQRCCWRPEDLVRACDGLPVRDGAALRWWPARSASASSRGAGGCSPQGTVRVLGACPMGMGQPVCGMPRYRRLCDQRRGGDQLCFATSCVSGLRVQDWNVVCRRLVSAALASPIARRRDSRQTTYRDMEICPRSNFHPKRVMCEQPCRRCHSLLYAPSFWAL